MVSGWTIFLVLLGVYLLVAYLVNARNRDREGSSVELAGPFLMWKTRRGRAILDRLGRAKRFWGWFGDAGIVAVMLAGLFTFLLLLFTLYVYATQTTQAVSNAPAPVEILGIPGVNPIIPLGYGIVALVVALIVHEGAHGVLARASDLKVKTLGLVFFIVPIGAFVEPDETDLEAAGGRAKNRVFSAGPMANLVLALAAALVFSTVLLGGVGVANHGEGVGIVRVSPGSGAAAAGIQPGMIITDMNGLHVAQLGDFYHALNNTTAGERVSIVALYHGHQVTRNVTLTDKYAYYQEHYPQANNASYHGEGFLGVGVVGMQGIAGVDTVLRHPLSHGVAGFFEFISYPLLVFSYQIDILASPMNAFLVPTGFAAALGGSLWVLANGAYWIFWINFMLGTFNALPAGPLDGGHMFKTTLRGFLYRRFGVTRDDVRVDRDEETDRPMRRGTSPEAQTKVDRVEGIVSRASLTVGLFILGLILLPIVVPPIFRLFA